MYTAKPMGTSILLLHLFVFPASWCTIVLVDWKGVLSVATGLSSSFVTSLAVLTFTDCNGNI